jgi:hypothetical protein
MYVTYKNRLIHPAFCNLYHCCGKNETQAASVAFLTSVKMVCVTDSLTVAHKQLYVGLSYTVKETKDIHVQLYFPSSRKNRLFMTLHIIHGNLY